VKYGIGVLKTTVTFVAHKAGIAKIRIFDATGRKLTLEYYSQGAPVGE
jgi:hypothetical protein